MCGDVNILCVVFQTNARLLDIEKEYNARSQRSNEVCLGVCSISFEFAKGCFNQLGCPVLVNVGTAEDDRTAENRCNKVLFSLHHSVSFLMSTIEDLSQSEAGAIFSFFSRRLESDAESRITQQKRKHDDDRRRLRQQHASALNVRSSFTLSSKTSRVTIYK